MTMLTNSEQNVIDVKFFDKLFAVVFSSSPKPRTHNFTHQVEGVNYVLEAVDGNKVQMTGYGKGIKCGDYIILAKNKILYRVEEIDYYASPMDLWTALLSPLKADK
jgi:hypothetical protein